MPDRWDQAVQRNLSDPKVDRWQQAVDRNLSDTATMEPTEAPADMWLPAQTDPVMIRQENEPRPESAFDLPKEQPSLVNEPPQGFWKNLKRSIFERPEDPRPWSDLDRTEKMDRVIKMVGPDAIGIALTGSPGVGKTAVGSAIRLGGAFAGIEGTKQVIRGAQEKVTGQDYGYTGATGVAESFVFGAALSAAASGAKAAWKALSPIETSAALKFLGLKEGATEEEIRRSAQNLAKQYHPDKVKGHIDDFKEVIRMRDQALKDRGLTVEDSDIVKNWRNRQKLTGEATPAATQTESIQRIEAAGYDTKTAEKIATDIQELQAKADAIVAKPAPLTTEQSKNVTATLAELEQEAILQKPVAELEAQASKPSKAPAEAASVPEAQQVTASRIQPGSSFESDMEEFKSRLDMAPDLTPKLPPLTIEQAAARYKASPNPNKKSDSTTIQVNGKSYTVLNKDYAEITQQNKAIPAPVQTPLKAKAVAIPDGIPDAQRNQLEYSIQESRKEFPNTKVDLYQNKKGDILFTYETDTGLMNVAVKPDGSINAIGHQPVDETKWTSIQPKPTAPAQTTPPAAAKAVEGVQPKEPWEMTRDEYAKTSSVVRGNNYIAVKSPRDGGDFIIRSLETSKYSDADAIALSRKDHIRQALSSGKPVPPAVLAEYPELKQLPKKGEGKPDYLDEGLELSIDVVHTKTALGTEAPLHLPEGRYRFKVTQDPNLKSNWFLQLVDDSGNPTQTKTIDGKTFAGYGTSKSRPTIISGMTQIQPKGTPDVQKETAQALQVENSKAAATAGEIPAPASVDKYRGESQKLTDETEQSAKSILPIEINASDIPFDFAVRANSGIHMIPEDSAYINQRDYLNRMVTTYKDLLPYAKTDIQKEILKSEMVRFKDGLRKKTMTVLSARSRVVSSFIAGPSKFPVERMNKRADIEHKRIDEMFEWADKAKVSIRKKMKEQGVHDAGGPIVILEREIQQEEQGHAKMKRANEILREKGLTKEQKVDKIVSELGFKLETAHKLFTPDYAGKIGVPGFHLTNTLARLKQKKARLEELKRAESKSGEESVSEYDGATIVNNNDIERVQLLFENKPTDAAISDLRGSGWHWSPSNKAWQRKNTPQAIRNAKEILDRHYKKSGSPSGAMGSPNRGGFLMIPEKFADFAEYVVRLFSPAESRIGKLGTSGKKLVARAKRAYEISQVHGANDTETMQKVTDKLTKAEKDTLGYAVNYVAWKKDPNATTRNSMKKRGGNLMAAPTSKAQEKAARAFLFLADRARRQYAKVGGDVRWGGIPWPQRFTKDGYKLYTEAIKAVDKDGNPILTELKRNGLIQKMVATGQYADEGQAWKALKRLEAQTKRQVYAYMEKSKTPLPAEYLEMGATIARDLEFWTSMHQHVELAKEFGIEHELAFEYLRDIEAVNGKDAAQSTLEWWREVIGDEQPKGEGQIWKERIARGLGQFQVFKLSPFTSAQNVFQRFLTMMDYGLITTLRGQQLAWTNAGREAARRSGSIPFRADESGLLTELSTEKARGIARAWIEAIGMGFTERGNNYTSSMTASLGIIQDLHDLAKGTSKLGQIIRNIFTLGGESKGAIQRRLQRQGINWKAVTKRGYLTADELRVAMLRAAKSKQFRSDLFSMPSWWQDSPMWRQVFRYKPFSYHTMTQIWTMAGSEAVKGNFRPLIAFLLVTTITGEVYNYLKGKLTDTDRDDETIKYRLLKDFADGGGLGLFSSLLWGKDLIDYSVNFIGGPNLSTARNLLETIQKTKDAPEHAKEHWLEAVQREIPAVRQLMNLADRDAAKNRIENAKVRKMFDGKDADLFYYGNDLYDAALKEDREGVRYAMEAMRHHGMEDDAILQSVTSRKKIKISGKEQAEKFPNLNPGEKAMVDRKLAQHDKAVGVVKSMLAVGKIDPKVSSYYSEISRVRGKDGRGEELTKDEDMLLKKNAHVQRAITHWQQKADEATDGKVRQEYYDRIKNLIDRVD